MFSRTLVILMLGATMLFSPRLHASMLFIANLTGSQEVPPTGSTGIGSGSVLLNDAMDMITVNESWSGLTGPATASHIHQPAPPGSTAAVVFPFAGVPAAAAGSIPQQTFAITAAQVAQLTGGLAYMNVHTANFPGGEIRGQLLLAPIPEPATGLFLSAGLCGIALLRRRMARS